MTAVALQRFADSHGTVHVASATALDRALNAADRSDVHDHLDKLLRQPQPSKMTRRAAFPYFYFTPPITGLGEGTTRA